MQYKLDVSGVISTVEGIEETNVITIRQEQVVSDDIQELLAELEHQITALEEKLSKKIELMQSQIKMLEDKVAEQPENPVIPPEQSNTYNVLEYGAVPGDGKSDLDAFTKCFVAAGNNTVIIPDGTYNLPWNKNSTFNFNQLMTCIGTGRISIDNFPQPGDRKTNFNPDLINPAYEDGFGRFDIADVKDDVFMSMNMLHEHRSNMDMYHQNYAAVKTRYNQNDNFPKWVPWGQCALRLDKQNATLPTSNATFNIGKFGCMLYSKTTKKWTIQSNPYSSNGSFYLKSYTGQTIALKRTPNESAGYVSYTVPVNKMKDYIVHFWTDAWQLEKPTDVEYAIVFMDCWLDSSTPNLENYFVCNLGLDTKTDDWKDIDEFLTGRFIDIKYKKRRNFVHNIMEPDYDRVTGGGANINKMIDEKSYTVLG